MARKIPIARLKAKHRKVTRSGGRASLTIDTPSSPAIRFRSIRREGTKFVLLAAGPLVERSVGGVFTNARGFTRYPELVALRREAERDLPAAVEMAIKQHLAKVRK